MRGFITWWGQVPVLHRSRTIVTLGAVCSVVLVLASFVVGYVGSISDLWTVEEFRLARANSNLTAIAAFVVCLSLFGLVFAWILLGRLVRRRPESSTKLVVTASVAWGLPMLFALPMSSRDVFAYLGQSKLIAGGIDPYTSGVAQLQGWASLGVDPLWSQSPTPYGPIWVLIEKLIGTTLLPVSYFMAMVAFRLIAAGGLALMGYFAWRLTLDAGRHPAPVLWLILASPLVLVNFVLGAHNDALMVALVLAGVHFAYIRKPWLAFVFITLASGVKLVAIIALPVVGLVYLRENSTLAKKLGYWALLVVGALGLLTLVGMALGTGPQWIWQSASTPASAPTWFAPVAIVGAAVWAVLQFFVDHLPLLSVIGVVGKLGMLAGVTLGGLILLSRRSWEPMVRLTYAFSAVVLLSPTIHPWYLVWLLVFAAVAGMLNSYRAILIVTVGTVMLTIHMLLARFYDVGALSMVWRIAYGLLVLIAGALAGWFIWNTEHKGSGYAIGASRQPA